MMCQRILFLACSIAETQQSSKYNIPDYLPLCKQTDLINFHGTKGKMLFCSKSETSTKVGLD